jgi:hypothetical protein
LVLVLDAYAHVVCLANSKCGFREQEEQLIPLDRLVDAVDEQFDDLVTVEVNEEVLIGMVHLEHHLQQGVECIT